MPASQSFMPPHANRRFRRDRRALGDRRNLVRFEDLANDRRNGIPRRRIKMTATLMMSDK